MAINDFYKGTTKKFSVTILYNGSVPDITGDTVVFWLKKNKTDTDASAQIESSADVSAGDGVANFTISKTDTAIGKGAYYYEIVWNLATGEEYVLESGTVSVLERVEDVD